LAEFWYNSSYHSSLGCTPFKALYGYDPQVIAAPMVPPTDNKSVQEMLSDRQFHTEFLKQHLMKAQHRIKMQADKNRVDREFQTGEKVLLKLHPYAQTSLVNWPYSKLSYKFFGPYTVVHRVGKATYKSDLPSNCQIHPVFHVSQLKPFTDDFTLVYSELPVTADFSQVHLQLEAILERRWSRKAMRQYHKFMSSGKGSLMDQRRRRTGMCLSASSLMLRLGGKTVSAGGGVTPAV
jgi:hypothetical protein